MWFYVDTISPAVDRLTSEIRRLSQWKRRPVFSFVTLVDKDAFMLVYAVSALPSSAADAAERRLTVSVLGAEPQTTVHAPDATSLGEISVPRDSSVILSLTDVDTSGTVSEPAVLEFVARDTIAPTQPQGLGVKLVRDEVV